MKRFIALFAVALGACALGQGQVDVSTSKSATFPGAPAGKDLAGVSTTTDASLTLDFQDDLASLGNLGALSATMSQNSVSGTDLNVIRHIRATLATKDGTIPEQVASDVDVPEASTEVELPLLISDSQLLAFLSEGKVVLHVYLTGSIPEHPFTLTYMLMAQVSVAMKGSIL
jgi:hypothetical protein